VRVNLDVTQHGAGQGIDDPDRIGPDQRVVGENESDGKADGGDGEARSASVPPEVPPGDTKSGSAHG
jgi:hypothetical protein